MIILKITFSTNKLDQEPSTISNSMICLRFSLQCSGTRKKLLQKSISSCHAQCRFSFRIIEYADVGLVTPFLLVFATIIKPITATRPYCSHPGFQRLQNKEKKAFFQIFKDRKIPYSFSFPEVPWSVRSHQYPLLY